MGSRSHFPLSGSFTPACGLLPSQGAGDLGEEEGEQKQACSMIVLFIGLFGCLKLTFSMETWEVLGVEFM